MGIKVVVVDMSSMMTSELCKTITNICLQEVSLLADCLNRVAFMLACLSTHTEILYPLQILNEGTQCTLKHSVNSLVQFHKDTPLTEDCSEQSLNQCVQFILNEAQKFFSHTYNQVAGAVDILFITCQTQLKIKVDSVFSKQSLSPSRKVTVLTIEEEKEASELLGCLTEIDDISAAPYYTDIQRPIRGWFFGQEIELVTLFLPDNLAISCDMVPMSIDIASLSTDSQYHFSLKKPVIPCHIQERQKARHLKGVKLFDLDQVCESVLSGSPMLLIPSTHWTMEWETLEENRHNFAAFCKSLAESDSALLCQGRDSQEMGGLFLLLTEKEGTAIIKPIICSELLLPKPSVPLIVKLSDKAIQTVGDSLRKLERAEEPYSPLENTANLHNYLLQRMEPKKRVPSSLRKCSERNPSFF
ncbi:hypothetical protein ACHWQZ_G003089 [Mnemiopsis leidyi]